MVVNGGPLGTSAFELGVVAVFVQENTLFSLILICFCCGCCFSLG